MKEGRIETKVSRFLFQYCITPQTTTGVAPTELLSHWGRRVEKKTTESCKSDDMMVMPKNDNLK